MSSMKQLYAHQHKALEMLKQSLKTGHKRPLLQAPTGDLWREVKDAPRYWISNSGQVISTIRQWRFLKQTLTPQGYPYVSLMVDGKPKKFTVHRLVAEHFIKGCGETVNHRDGVKDNNHYSNLEWCSYAENNNHARDNGLVNNFGDKHYKAILSSAAVINIRDLAKSGMYHKDIAQIYGVARQTITKVVSNKTWRRS